MIRVKQVGAIGRTFIVKDLKKIKFWKTLAEPRVQNQCLSVLTYVKDI